MTSFLPSRSSAASSTSSSRAAELHAASLAAAAGVDLGLDDPELAADLAGTIGRLFGAVGERALGHGHTEAGQDFLGLVFVNIHGQKSSGGS